MNRKDQNFIVIAAAMALVVTSPVVAAPACGVGPGTGLSADEVAAHRLFPEPVISYEGGPSGYIVFDLLANVDKTGKASQSFHGVLLELPAKEDESVKKALYAAEATWRYKPFKFDGKPVDIGVYQRVVMVPPPIAARPMPMGRLNDSGVRLETECIGFGCADYAITLNGNGQAEFQGGRSSDFHGTLSWNVSPGEVAALIERIRSRDLWNARELYWCGGAPGSIHWLTIASGGQHKTVEEYLGDKANAPEGLLVTEAEIERLTEPDQWTHMTLQSVERLAELGFDFKSAQAGDTVFSIIENRNGDTKVIQALLEHGAPIRGRHPNHMSYNRVHPTTLVTAAIATGRTELADDLIQRGALDKPDGSRDHKAIQAAFETAISAGNIPLFKRLLTEHPTLTYPSSEQQGSEQVFVRGQSGLKLAPGTKRKVRQISVVFLMADDSEDRPELLDELMKAGADVHGTSESGQNLLHYFKYANGSFMKFLISLGLDVNARDEDGNTPILTSGREEGVLALLEAGANPMATNNEGEALWTRRDEAFADWPLVAAWLKAHGYHSPART